MSDKPMTFPVVYLPPKTLKPYYRNNKIHSRQQITHLAQVLRKHGFDQPIVVDKDNVIIKGHGRWQASVEASYPLVPVVVRDDLTEVEVQASRVADNQSFALSDIDTKLSHEEIASFVSEGGVGAEFFFDFLQPKVKNTNPPAAAAGVKVKGISGSMVSCPRCAHTQMEVSK